MSSAVPGSTAEDAPSGHIVVVGTTSTAVRLVDELERAGERVMVLAVNADPGVVDDMSQFGAETHAVTHVREAELRRVHIHTARVAVVLGFDDVFTTRVALAIEELNAQARLVLELSNPNFSRKLQSLLGECVVLSSATLAAPAFVAAATSTGDVASFTVGGRLVSAGPVDRIGGDRLAVLGNSRADVARVLLPEGDGDIVLGTGAATAETTRLRTSGVWGAISSVFDRRLRYVLVGLLILVLVSVLYFHFVGRQGWLLSTYLALTASTLTGIGDDDLPISARFGGVVIQLFGVVLSSGITAVIVDALIKARISDLTGGVRGHPRHHAVVCGLGRIGTSVMVLLHRQGIPVVAIERNEDSLGVLRARRLKVPVIIAEATDSAALEQAGIDTADAVLAVTDDDAVNLEIALVAKDENPGVRVVTRLFDHDLADRVERRLELGPTRSVSMVAAPAFAAAATGRRSERVLSVGRRVLLFTELTIRDGSEVAAGCGIDDLSRTGAVRVLAVRRRGKDGPGTWDWTPSGTVAAGDEIAVAATRHGLAELRRRIK